MKKESLYMQDSVRIVRPNSQSKDNFANVTTLPVATIIS